MSDCNESIPTREELDSSKGIILLEFGAEHCGFCQAAKVHIVQGLSKNPEIKHIKIEDGPGKKLGRSFGVKLWPTLILLQDGKEISRVVRPERLDEILSFIETVGT